MAKVAYAGSKLASIASIKSQVTLSHIIGSRVKLTEQSSRVKGLCPFHNEKTPSFTVNDGEGYYHCFGCGAHGDVFDFVANYESISFMEALRKVASEANLSIDEKLFSTAESRRQDDGRDNFYNTLELVAEWFSGQLTSSMAGMSALEYLYGRGITDDSVARFRLGYCPSDIKLFDAFIKKCNISVDVLRELGLMGASVSRAVFSGRLMFPICNTNGKIIGFAGRVVGDDASLGQSAKYINSCESLVFKKKNHFYGMHLAIPAANKKREIIVVEGYIDVIMLRQSGIGNVVASMGTALAPDRIAGLWKKIRSIVVCFDGDDAGRNAMSRLAMDMFPLLNSVEYDLSFVLLPQGTDPADAVAKNGADVLSRTLDLSEMVFGCVTRSLDMGLPTNRAQVEARLNAFIRLIPHAELRRYYKHYFKEQLYNLCNPHKKSIKKSELSLEEVRIAMSDEVCKLEIFLVTEFPALLRKPGVEEDFFIVMPLDKQLAQIKSVIAELFHSDTEISRDALLAELEHKFGIATSGGAFNLRNRFYVDTAERASGLLHDMVWCWRDLESYDAICEDCASKVRNAMIDNSDGLDDLFKLGEYSGKFNRALGRLRDILEKISDLS